MKKCNRTSDGCLEWSGATTSGGYPELTYYKGRKCHINVRNTMHENTNGMLEKNNLLKNSCSLGLHCVEPSHLTATLRYPENDKVIVYNRLRAKCEIVDSDCLVYNNFEPTKLKKTPQTTHLKKGQSVYRLMFWTKSEYKTIEDIPRVDEHGIALQISHSCGNHWCVNRDHLRLATIYENNYDDKHLHGTLQRGDRHHNVKYSDALCLEIATATGTVKERAGQFGVPVYIVRQIDNGTRRMSDDVSASTMVSRLQQALQRKKATDRLWTAEQCAEGMERLKNNSLQTQIVSSMTPCWIWQLSTSYGYGRIKIYGRQSRAHIISCELKYQRRRVGKEVVRHICDVRLCCNPDHLEFGTQRENIADRDKNGHRGNYKLTNEQIVIIRDMYIGGHETKKIAERFGITKGTVLASIRRLFPDFTPLRGACSPPVVKN